MSELVIRYAISKRLKLQALVVSIFLMIMSIYIAVSQLLIPEIPEYNVYFFIGVVGILISLSLIISVTVSQPKPLVVLDNEDFVLNFPKQRLHTTIYWNDVTHVGIGLSYVNLMIADKELSVDLEVLRYHDLKVLKSKIMEIAESKNIAYNNI